jgi:pimeloyl-ACP methyl ester carboxylesterase
MALDTHETAPTQRVQASNVLFAYRRFGPQGGIPLLLLNYFAANLDNWDPTITNGFAAERDVIIVDYPGMGSSSGEMPSTVAALTKAPSNSVVRSTWQSSMSLAFRSAA